MPPFSWFDPHIFFFFALIIEYQSTFKIAVLRLSAQQPSVFGSLKTFEAYGIALVVRLLVGILLLQCFRFALTLSVLLTFFFSQQQHHLVCGVNGQHVAAQAIVLVPGPATMEQLPPVPHHQRA